MIIFAFAAVDNEANNIFICVKFCLLFVDSYMCIYTTRKNFKISVRIDDDESAQYGNKIDNAVE